MIGDDSANQITGNAGDNALYGGGGDDILIGGAGDDLLDGGADSDRLEGGVGRRHPERQRRRRRAARRRRRRHPRTAGAASISCTAAPATTPSVIGLNDNAIDTVFDHEGHNQLVLEGVTGHPVQTALVGDDLYLMVDDNAVATISGYRGHEDAWAGVDPGHGLTSVEDLMAQQRGCRRPAGLGRPATLSAAAAQRATCSAPI